MPASNAYAMSLTCEMLQPPPSHDDSKTMSMDLHHPRCSAADASTHGTRSGRLVAPHMLAVPKPVQMVMSPVASDFMAGFATQDTSIMIVTDSPRSDGSSPSDGGPEIGTLGEGMNDAAGESAVRNVAPDDGLSDGGALGEGMSGIVTSQECAHFRVTPGSGGFGSGVSGEVVQGGSATGVCTAEGGTPAGPAMPTSADSGGSAAAAAAAAAATAATAAAAAAAGNASVDGSPQAQAAPPAPDSGTGDAPGVKFDSYLEAQLLKGDSAEAGAPRKAGAAAEEEAVEDAVGAQASAGISSAGLVSAGATSVELGKHLSQGKAEKENEPYGEPLMATGGDGNPVQDLSDLGVTGAAGTSSMAGTGKVLPIEGPTGASTGVLITPDTSAAKPLAEYGGGESGSQAPLAGEGGDAPHECRFFSTSNPLYGQEAARLLQDEAAAAAAAEHAAGGASAERRWPWRKRGSGGSSAAGGHGGRGRGGLRRLLCCHTPPAACWG
eukprot:jgi/Ulvmu1/8640/UM046_0045.1